jgi:hypothetical protein
MSCNPTGFHGLLQRYLYSATYQLLAASAGFLLGLLFSSEQYGGDTFLQNIGWPANYMVL